ncbi:neurofilament medium polypeptide [Drosophila obscura]|uniref:neurofilament medium polypeptide n=1 Tax=Drosophila obscura TaxID=7282 RepID=UPI001BB25837|nr:neurofilament medium polypeptide [Drosophila obscura]
MEARGALSEGQAKAQAMSMEMSNEFITLTKASASGMEDFVRGMDIAMRDNSTLAEKSPRTMQNQEKPNMVAEVARGDHSPTDNSIQQIEQGQTPVERPKNESNARTNAEAEETEHTEDQVDKSSRNEDEARELLASEEPEKKEATKMIEKGQANEELSETYGEHSTTAEEKAKIKEREAKEQAKKETAMAREERKLKEKQAKEEKKRAQLNVLMEEARRGNESSRKSPQPEIKEGGTMSEPSAQAGTEHVEPTGMEQVAMTEKKVKKPKKGKAAKWKVDSVKMKEDMEQFLDGIKALEKKQREQDREEAEEAADIVFDDENIRGWKAVLKELSQTSSFSAATASLSSSQLSSAPRTVVRAILRRAAKMEYKNQLEVLKETYNYRICLLKKLKLDIKSNFKSEARELHTVYKKIRPPKF